MNSKYAAISVLGQDKPGIVASVSKCLFLAGCNIEDSSMTLLRSEFAMIVIIKLPAKKDIAEISNIIAKPLVKMGLTVNLKPLTLKEVSKEKLSGVPYMVSVYGADKPGIVFGVTNYLYQQKANITDVQTKISRTNGRNLYVMMIEIEIPKKRVTAAFSKGLKKVAKRTNVSVTLHQIESVSL